MDKELGLLDMREQKIKMLMREATRVSLAAVDLHHWCQVHLVRAECVSCCLDS